MFSGCWDLLGEGCGESGPAWCALFSPRMAAGSEAGAAPRALKTLCRMTPRLKHAMLPQLIVLNEKTNGLFLIAEQTQRCDALVDVFRVSLITW